MSSKLRWLSGDICIKDMVKSTSEIVGVLNLSNNSSIVRHMKDCILEVNIMSGYSSTLLLHSYTVKIDKNIEPLGNISIDLSIDGVALSSLASEVVDIELRVKGTQIKTSLCINRSDYIDVIESYLSEYSYELSSYGVDIRTKLMSKLFRQYYVYKCVDIELGYKDIKVTYTPYSTYIVMCVYVEGVKKREILQNDDIMKKETMSEKILEILNELKIV